MREKTIYPIALITLLALFSQQGFSQQGLTIAGLQGLPQASSLNPAFLPQTKAYISLPLLGQLQANVSHNSLTLGDLSNWADHRYALEVLLPTTTQQNSAFADASLSWVNMGMSFKNVHLGFSVSDRMDATLNYPKSTLELGAAVGQEEWQAGLTYDLSGFSLSALHYRAYAVSIAHQIGGFSGGIRLKYLQGLGGTWSTGQELSLQALSDPETWALDGRMDIWGVGLNNYGKGAGYNTAGTGNSGFAVDLGVLFTVSPKLSISAAVQNMGGITWKKGVNKYSLLDTMNQVSLIPSEVFAALKETPTQEFYYRTPLSSVLQLGATYQINERSRVMANFMPRLAYQQVNLAGSLAYWKSMNSWLQVVASVNALSGHSPYVGAGFMIDKAPIQFYFTTDNLLSVVAPKGQSYTQFNAGINWVWENKTTDVAAVQRIINSNNNFIGWQKEVSPNKKTGKYTRVSLQLQGAAQAALPDHFYLDAYKVDENGDRELVRTGRYLGNNCDVYLEQGSDHQVFLKVWEHEPLTLDVAARQLEKNADGISYELIMVPVATPDKTGVVLH
ncbi:MAG TPA: DUF5723 family protein [Saprospiraceae bacterium]|nr:DUF5723 family protein [Saprospiraceae bacterium]HMQ85541.1 DUF5723 family protein [Saprospiraceae bacterium]